MELDILCRRDWRLPDSLQGPADPYNVIGIFSGHTHHFGQKRPDAGLDVNGDTVFFDNIVINDAEGDGSYGYSIATLTGDELKLHTWDSKSGWRWDYLPYELP